MALNFAQINHNDTTYNGDYYQYWVQSSRDRKIHILNIPTIFQNADCDMECVINDFIEINDLNINMEEWGQLIGGIVEHTKLKIPEKSSEEEDEGEGIPDVEIECICGLCPMDNLYVSKKKAFKCEDVATHLNKCPLSLGLGIEPRIDCSIEDLWDELIKPQREQNPN